MKPYNVGLNTDGKKPRIVDDMYRSTEVKGENAMTKIHPHNKNTPKNGGAHGGRVNQYGEKRIISGR